MQKVWAQLGDRIIHDGMIISSPEYLRYGDPTGVDHKKSLWVEFRRGHWFKINTNQSIAPRDYPITPAHIRKGTMPIFTNGKEWIANMTPMMDILLEFAHKRGHWGTFTMEEVAELTGKEFWDFRPRLVSGFRFLGFVLKVPQEGSDWCWGRFAFTIGFIDELYQASERQKE